MNDRAQIANQVFIYASAAILFALVLLYGTSAVQNFMEKSEIIDMIELKNKLEAKVEEIAPTQDRMVFDFKVPSGHDSICFIDRSKGGETCDQPNTKCWDACQNTPDLHPLVCDAWIDNTTQNVFLLEPVGSTPIRTGPIQLLNASGADVGYLCFDVQTSNLKLVFRGKGDRVQIQQAK